MKERVPEATNGDENYLQVKEKLQQGKFDDKCEGYQLEEDTILLYKGRLFILNCVNMKKVIMDEIHQMPYSIHPGY